MTLRKLFVSLLIGHALFAISSAQEPADSARYLYTESRQTIATGDFLRSEFLLERILEKEYPLSDYQLGLVRNYLGYVYSETGRLEKAIEQYLIAESLSSGSDQNSLQLRITIHINQGIYHSALGDYGNALQYNNEALRLLSLIPEWDVLSYSKLSTLLLNKGIALYLMERYEEALEILKECEQIKESHNHAYLGSVYFNLARVYQSLGDFELSNRYYLKSIDRWSAEYDSNYYELANIYLHFGQFLNARGEHEQGFDYLQKALENYKRNYGTIHPLTAACYESLARHSLNQGAWEDALDYLQLALHSITGKFSDEDHFSNPEILNSSHDPTLLRILDTKADALEKASRHFTTIPVKTEYLHAALASSLLSIDVLTRIRNSYLSPESRIYLNSQQKNLFTTGIRINLELFSLTNHERYREEAFLMAARGKSGELMFEMKEKEWLYLESLPDTLALTVTELKQQNNHLSNLIQIENLSMNPDSARLVDLQNELFQTQDTFNKQMRQLRLELPEIGYFESSNIDFSINQIRRSLNRKESLVEYFLSGADESGKEELFIFVVTKQACYVSQSPVDSTFHQNLETITQNLHDFVPYNESKERFDSLKVALYGIYKEIIYPVESYFSGKNLIIVPDEMLSFIPFDALITQMEQNSITNYAGAPYLLHDYNISYMYNSQLIKHHPSRRWRFPEVIAWIPANANVTGNSYGKLRGAAEEVQGILKITNGRTIQKPLDKPELIGLLQEDAILHLAMHSLATEKTGKSPYFILDTISDPLLKNQMHDYEINALNLSSPMVVLSSCETAGGQLQQGEGIMSLSRSFLQAGAASVVHSLWPVEDEKSKDLMIGFYGEMKKGRSRSSALSRAKKQYLNEHPPFYTHPYYWAAFQITGDISPIHSRRRDGGIIGSVLLTFLIFYYLKRRNFFRRV